jgi:hypothetical protein
MPHSTADDSGSGPGVRIPSNNQWPLSAQWRHSQCGDQQSSLRPLFLAAAAITRIDPEACEPALAAEPSASAPRIQAQSRRHIVKPGYLGYPGYWLKSPAFLPILHR